MNLSDFDFELPEDHIALRPASPRDSARMLVVRPDEALQDRTVADLPSFLRAGDVLVFNDTRVIPARLFGTRVREETSVAVEATLHRRLSPHAWTAFMRPGKRLKVEFQSLAENVAERLTEGASSLTPSRCASPRNSLSLSVLLISSVIDAARNSTGWFAFIQAV